MNVLLASNYGVEVQGSTQFYLGTAFLNEGHKLFKARPDHLFHDIKNYNIPPVDLIMFIEGEVYLNANLHDLSMIKTIPKIMYAIDPHIILPLQLKWAMDIKPDIVFVTQKDYINEFEKLGFKTVWLPFATDPDIFKPYPIKKEYDIGMIGGLNTIRASFLRDLAEEYNVLVHSSDGGFNLGKCIFINKRTMLHEYAKELSRCKIGFNKSLGGDLTLRNFEMPSIGLFLITDRIKNGQEEIFNNDIGLYSSKDELLSVTKDALSNFDKTEESIKYLREKIIGNHTYRHRVKTILKETGL